MHLGQHITNGFNLPVVYAQSFCANKLVLCAFYTMFSNILNIYIPRNLLKSFMYFSTLQYQDHCPLQFTPHFCNVLLNYIDR